MIKDAIDPKINQHPFLCHRFQESNGGAMKMECHQHSQLVLRNNYSFIAHLHCFDLNEFETYYDDFTMNTLFRHCPLIIITFCEGNGEMPYFEQQSKIICLRIKNKGMDIGGKCCCVRFLHYQHITFDKILFLHSKSCPIRRTMYFRPLIEQIPFLLESFAQHPERGIYVPPLLHCGDYNNRILLMNRYFPFQKQGPWNEGNDLYMKELDTMMHLDPHNRYFPEGNCFVCNHDIAKQLYGNMTLYQCLNEPHSLDPVWFYCYHDKKKEMDPSTKAKVIVENIQKASKKHPEWPKNNLDGGNQGHPDNMLEHCFERMIFKVAQKLGHQVYILPCSDQKQHIEKTNVYTELINTFMEKTI